MMRKLKRQISLMIIMALIITGLTPLTIRFKCQKPNFILFNVYDE